MPKQNDTPSGIFSNFARSAVLRCADARADAFSACEVLAPRRPNADKPTAHFTKLRRFIQTSFLLYAAHCAKREFEIRNQARFRRNHIISVVAFNASAESYNYVVHLVREHGVYPLQPGEFDLADVGGSTLNSAEPAYEELK